MSRDVRNRLVTFREGLDRRDQDEPPGTERMLVQVYDGGLIPTTVPAVYLTHPVLLDAADTEGASYSSTADSTVTIPVVMLGPKVPAAGDLLIAHAIGGRWVAEQGGGPGGCDTVCFDCFGTGIPNKDLLFTWTGHGSVGSGSVLMKVDCTGNWTTPCIPGGAPGWPAAGSDVHSTRWTMACGQTSGGDFLVLTVEYFSDTGCSVPDIVLDDFHGVLPSTNPFSVTHTFPTTGGSAGYDHMENLGFDSITVSDPGFDTYCCFVYIIVYGCNSSFVSPGDPVPGATVTAWTDSGKATQIATGTTDFAGVVDLNIGNHAGSIYYEVDGHGFEIYSQTLSVTCGQYNANNPLTTTELDLYGNPESALVVKTGYLCTVSCASPIAKTLHATHPVFGAITYTYNGAGALGAGWYATVSYSYPSSFCCPAKTVTINCFLSTGFAYREDWVSH